MCSKMHVFLPIFFLLKYSALDYYCPGSVNYCLKTSVKNSWPLKDLVEMTCCYEGNLT